MKDERDIPGRLRKLYNKLRSIRVPYKIIFFIIGIASTVWFLVRVIPKPSRAGYPCMKVAAPFMSSLIIYLMGISVSWVSFKKFRQSVHKSRYLAGSLFLLLSVGAFAVIFLQDSKETIAGILAPTDNTFPVASNDPVGEGRGLFPGRVVWVHDKGATNENYVPETGSTDFWYSDDNADEEVIKDMLELSLTRYAGTSDITEAWDAIFKSFNKSHGRGEVGYTPGEKIAFKINLTNQGAKDWDRPNRMDATPQLLNAVLDQLVNVVGVAQPDITMGDPYRKFRTEYKELVMSKFPDVYYVDGAGGDGVHQTVPSAEAVLKFSDKEKNYESTLPQQYLDATYVINIPCLKTHNEGGITLIAKNHQGSYLAKGSDPKGQYAILMHYSLPWNSRGSGKYRHTVDYMGHEETGGKGLIYIIDGLWGGDSWEGWIMKFKSDPFGNDYPNSLFVGQDPVALESVCYDILFQENVSDPDKRKYPIDMKVEIADYLKQCASSNFWPAGVEYDPEGDGTLLGSLGVFEHWNNPADKQYSRNLGYNYGIELIADKSLVESTVSALEAETVPLIDGDPADDCWDKAQWYYIDQTWITWGEEIDPFDFSGRFKVNWSESENLVYYLVEITDDAFIDGYVFPDDGYYNYDVVEVFIDEDASGGMHTYDENAFAYHINVNAPAEGETESFFYACDLADGNTKMNYADHIPELSLKKMGNTYCYEFSMAIYNDTYDHANPEASRVTLEGDKEMGLSIAWCDNDSPDGSRDNFFGSVWVPSGEFNDHWQNADGFGRVRLVKTGASINQPVEIIGTIADFLVTELNTDLVIQDNLLMVFDDPDGDELAFTVNCDEEALAFTVTDNVLTVNASAAFDGAVEATVTASDGEFDISISFHITASITGKSEIGTDAEISCYPNPFSDLLYLDLNLASGFTGPVVIKVYNMAGMNVLTHTSWKLVGGNGELSIDLGDKPDGNYLLQIAAGAEIHSVIINKQ